jgi:hypothetical protein
MTEQDKEHIRDLAAMFAMNGYLSKMACDPKASGDICENGEINADAIARASYIFADAMLEARKTKEEGIVAIKRRVKIK